MADTVSRTYRLPSGRCQACLGQARHIEDLPELLAFLVEDTPDCVCPYCGRSFVTVGAQLLGFLQRLDAASGRTRRH